MIEEDPYNQIPITQNKKIPLYLKLIYVTFPIGGIIAFILYWNGSHGWLDRGSWKELQKAAYTTYPFQSEKNHPKE